MVKFSDDIKTAKTFGNKYSINSMMQGAEIGKNQVSGKALRFLEELKSELRIIKGE